ncbi:MAG: urate hydroxylase PuuD [Pseudomonadales bacterium]|nr:urate hydroxylase PuuD [Pseudomonadales bacterium]
MEAYLVDWFSVILRWLHLITGIAWIGASLHFVWLDNSLEDPGEEKKADGVKGELWSIHGGGIYNFNKYHLAPPKWPSILHWSKWEAYTTWMTGTLLMVAVYYLQAQSYLVGSGKWITDPGVAVVASIGYLLSGTLVYEALVRSPLRHRESIFVVLLAVFIAAQCWLATQLFSDRAAYLHVGALMGTIMAGNVFLGIIPAQKKFVAAVQAGEEPDPAPAAFAKQRSTHNNYFTLPVLFCMISNHYPFLYGHELNWLILIAIIAITAYARHFFNLRHRGVVNYWILVRACLGFLLLAGWLGYDRHVEQQAALELQVADEAAYALIDKHCTVCHAEKPTQPGFLAPPAGILMDDRDAILGSTAQMATAIKTDYMPLGNLTGMTPEEKTELVAWLEHKGLEQ